MLMNAVSICIDLGWPSGAGLRIIAAIAVAMGLLARSILVPFSSGLFPVEVWNHWPPLVQFFVIAILRIDWAGYLAVFFIFFTLDTKFHGRWHFEADVLASLLVAALYASQFVALYFGNVREHESNTSA
jgi:hypothetical protein